MNAINNNTETEFSDNRQHETDENISPVVEEHYLFNSIQSHTRAMSNLLSILILILFFGKVAIGQDKTKEIDSIFNWTRPDAPGCVCAVAENGKLVFNRAYGSADLERNVPLTTASVFDAGSLVKQFIAASVLMLAEEGKLSLTGDIRTYFPGLPDYGYKITIDHLLTHTSGIRDWTGITPYTANGTDALKIVLRQRELNFIPGEEWSYSNSGYVLLREIVARASGMSFAAFVAKRLFEPLGMHSTAYHHDLRTIIKNRTQAYEKSGGRWRMAMLLDNDRGGQGALFTSAADLLIWNDALENNRLGNSVSENMQKPARLNNGRLLGYARGLFIDSMQNNRFWWHSGSADGYKALLARFPGQKLSVAILCNSGDDTDRTGFARRIFNLYSNAPEKQTDQESSLPAVAEGIKAENIDLKSKAGLYFNETTGEPLRLVAMNGRLRIANGPFLVAIAEDRFKRWGNGLNFMSGDEFSLHFSSQNQMELQTMEGKTIRYRKAEPYSPKPETLKSFTGRFLSDEMGTAFLIEQKGEGLIIRMEHAPEKSLDLSPVDTDTFQRGMITVRFRRDTTGRVISFDFSNPLIRKIPFSRLKDHSINP